MKRRNKALLIATAALMTISLSLTSAPTDYLTVSAAYIDPDTDATVLSIESQISSIEGQLTNLENSISSKKSDIQDATADKTYYDTKLSLVGQEITLANDYLTALQNSIDMKEQEISDKEVEIKNKYSEFEEWIRAFYETGEMSYVQMIFDNDNFTDVLTTTEYIAAIMESKNELMSELESELTVLNSDRADLETSRQKQTDTIDKLAVQKSEYESLATESADYISSLRDDQAAYEAEYKKVQEESEKLNADLKAELEKIALQNAVYVGGTYMWPVDITYNYISSPYGWRSYNGGEFHLGIDIPCPFGTTICASNAGEIIKAEYNYSYGYYVLIDHGGGQATLYAHNSQLLVSVGDTVVKGQAIALAGSTGNSQGNHCHFEFRVNGETTNPLDYVTQP